MSYLLDLCVISELIKPKPHPEVTKWIEGCEERDLFLSVLTFGELERGIAKLPESKKKRRIRTWVDGSLARRFSGRVLSIDLQTAALWGATAGIAEKKGKPIPLIDGLLGASARIHKLTLATRKTTDLLRTGAEIFDPWEGKHYSLLQADS